MIQDFLWWVGEKSWLNGVCLSACLFKTLAPGAPMGGQIEAGKAPFDTPEGQNDDGVNRGAIGAM